MFALLYSCKPPAPETFGVRCRVLSVLSGCLLFKLMEDESVEEVCEWLSENADVPSSVLDDDFRGKKKPMR